MNELNKIKIENVDGKSYLHKITLDGADISEYISKVEFEIDYQGGDRIPIVKFTIHPMIEIEVDGIALVVARWRKDE